MRSLVGRTILVTGASRGIGRAIALRAAADGANVAIAAKTVEPHGKLQGTIHETARGVEAAGGKALAIQVDVRDDARIEAAVAETVARFGGLDAVVHNAGAIALVPVEQLSTKLLDRMLAINLRAAFVLARASVPHLKKSPHAHILHLSPPIELRAEWFAGFAGYTVSKFGLSMLTLGLAEELRPDGIAVNSLWPRTTIATAAVEMLGGEAWMNASRTPAIVADAAQAILTTPARELTGRWLIDEEVLRERGVTDFDRYAVAPGTPLQPDLYVNPR